MTTTMAPEEKRRTLATAVQNPVVGGWRVESQTDEQAIMVRGKPPNHILHLILTLVTLGAWVIVWLALVIFGGEKRQIINVDDYGNTLITKV